jgi:hypothetical protein
LILVGIVHTVRNKPREIMLPRVIIIELSGVNNGESLDDVSRQYFPKFFSDIVPHGLLFTNLRDQNLLFHMTQAQAINTGMIHSFYGEEKAYPSIAQYLRDQYDIPQEKVWIYGQWHENTMAVATPALRQKTFPALLSVQDFEVPPFLGDILSEEDSNFLTSLREVKERGISQWTFWDSVERPKFAIFKKIRRDR